MKTHEVLDHLSRVHPTGQEWFFTREFSRIDAYAVRLFQGSGKHTYRRVAYEVKVSWEDFLSELRQPEKRLGALDLSHQFYFAMPAELAAKALARVTLDVPEAGLIAIHEDAQPLRFRSPCVGAVYTPHVRVLRKAPLRPCRAWTMLETTNLLRRQHGGTEDALRRDLADARARAKARGQDEKRAKDELAVARAALADHLGHTVEVGSEWQGKLRHWRTTAQQDVVVRVQAVDRYSDSFPPLVRARRLDAAGDPMQGWEAGVSLELGEFLTVFRPSHSVASVREVG